MPLEIQHVSSDINNCHNEITFYDHNYEYVSFGFEFLSSKFNKVNIVMV